MEVVTAYNLVVDSNVETPASYTPRSAYLGVKISNTGTSTLTDIYVKMGDLTNTSTGAGTPGVYPVTSVLQTAGWGYYGDFSLTHEGGVADASRYIQSLAAGASTVVYGLVSYPVKDARGKTVTGATNSVTDDLRLNYDVWVQATEVPLVGGSIPRLVYDERHLTCRNEISAMANKIWPNTASKVPDPYLNAIQETLGWRPTTSPRVPGAIKTEGIWYDLGNVGAGFDNNGDLIPDRNAWMQPVGDPALFDASALRLVKCYGIVIVKLNDGTEQLIPFEDRLYFEHILANNTGAVGLVYYEFMPLRSGATATLSPYQEVASGYNNEKFNGDYGTSFSTGTAPAPSVTINKTASPATVVKGGNVTYTMDIANTSGTTAFGDPDLGLPATVSDTIPAGTTYVLHSASATVVPSGNSVLIRYSTDSGVTWTTTEPASGVTNLQWVFAATLQPSATARVTFQTTVPTGYAATSVSNTAGFGLDSVTPLVTSSATTLITGTRTISGTVFADTASGATYANGVLDSGETGIGSIRVSLYVDSNNDGLLDPTDPLWGSVNSASNGTYSFTSLPSARFIVVVDQTDSDLSAGYALTSSSAKLAANVTAGDSTGNNFGFAPALELTKTLTGTSPVYEGDLVSYTITARNTRPGDGSGTNLRSAWATTATTDSPASKAWLTPANAQGVPRPADTAYAYSSLNNATDTLHLTGWNIPGTLGTISKVELALDLQAFGAVNTSTYSVAITKGGTTTTVIKAAAMSGVADGILYTEVTSIGWTATDFTNGTAVVDITATKGGSPTGQFRCYAGGFRVTGTVGGAADSNTLNPVPLTDIYDADLLQLVSASPAQTSASIAGTDPNRVGTLNWSNLGPIYPGGTKTVTVTFRALEPHTPGSPNTQQTGVRNTAAITQATYQNGVDSGDATSYVDVTLAPTGTIGDFIWSDLNNNGTWNTGEPGIPNVTVFLDTNNNGTLDTGEISTTTDASGSYLFSAIRSNGPYNVRVLTTTLPGGSGTNTRDREGTPGNSVTAVTLNVTSTTGGDNVLDADFGYFITNSTIRGTLWNDLNRGAEAAPATGEPRFAGITVTLYNSSGVVQGTTTTDANGNYSFTGNYATGIGYYVQTTPTTGDMAGKTWTASYDTDGTGAPLNRVTFNLVQGSVNTANFSYYESGSYSIGDTVFYDWNKNGTQDTGEKGISGVTVRLYNTAGFLLAATTTNASGVYAFTGRANGSYTVVVDEAGIPTGFTQTNHSGTSGVTAVTLNNATDNTVDFGYAGAGTTSSIGDFVYYDSNDNGTQDSGEPGIAGVPVELYWDTNGDGSPDGVAIASTVTADGSNVNYPQGFYQFTNLPPNPAGWYYMVKVVTTMTQTADPDRDGEGRQSTLPNLPPFDNMDSKIVLGATPYTGADFGYLPASVIGDFVWLDQNGNGVQDAGEAGLAGVTVTASKSGSPDVTTTTDNDGHYSFANLADGTWTIAISGTPLTGKLPTYDADGTATANSTTVTLTGGVVTNPAGKGSLDIDFGLKVAGSYSLSGGVCIHDTRTLGLCDDVDSFADDGTDLDVGPLDETELSGLSVYLYTEAGAYLGMTTTDAAGKYAFSGLPNGNYQVVLDSTPSPLNHATLNIPATLPGGVTSITPSATATNPTTVVSTVTIASANVTHVDYAFNSTVEYDFGDLPSSYEATTWANDGARHLIPAGGATVYLGSVPPDAEANGQPTASASGDDLNGTANEEAGVVPYNIGSWHDGVGGGSVQVTIPNGVSGYLVGWIDWNHNNTLTDLTNGTSENIIGRWITGTGSPQTLTFDIPAGTIGATGESWLARFRIFAEQPAYPLFAYKGEATNGEVEDYQFQRLVNAAIGDRVWVDTNGNGVQDAGEFGLGGVTVTLKDSGGATITAQTTSNGSQDADGDGVVDPAGYYRFPNLAAANYTVSISLPAGYSYGYDEDGGGNGSAAVTLAANAQHLSADFGLVPQTANIAGAVFNDANHDNAFGGDTPLSAVVVQLWTDPNKDGNPGDGVQVAEAFTDGNGAYLFTNVPSGPYVVVEIDPGGAASVTDKDGVNDNRIRVDLSGTDSTANNFLDYGTAILMSVRGTVLDDANGLTDSLVNGTGTNVGDVLYANLVDGSGKVVSAAAVAADGSYSFSGLSAGTYTVVLNLTASSPGAAAPAAALPANWVNTGEGTNPAGDGTINGLLSITLTTASVTGANFGIDQLPDTANLTATEQTNPGGTAQVTVPTFAGTDPEDGTLGSGKSFRITSLPATGTLYYNGAAVTLNQVITGYDPARLTVDPNDGAVTVSFTYAAVDAAGKADPTPATVSMPFTMLATIGNLVWEDLNNNGLVDAGEPGFDGVTVQLWRDLDDNGVFEPSGADSQTPLSTVTAGGGFYSFASVQPAKYFVVIPTPPAFHLLSSMHTTTLDNQVDNDDNGIQTGGVGALTVSPAVDLATGEIDNTVDFGFIDPGVGNLVWADLNNDGLVQANEPGIANVVVELHDAAGSKLLATTTDANGFYLFTGQAPESYTVRIPALNFLPGGALEHYRATSTVVVTSDNQTDDDNNGSQPAGPGTVVSSPLIVLTGTGEPVDAGTETGRGNALDNGDDAGADMTVDFGFIQTGLIAGTVRTDSDNNGSGDAPLAGVILNLLDASGNPVDGDPATPGTQAVTATTGADGSYLFNHLLPATYQVSESQPAAYGSVSDVDGGNPDLIGNSTPLTVAQGQDVTGRDFVEIELGAISGYVYVESTPLAGVTLTLLDQSGNPLDGDPNTPGVQPITTVTNSLGFYTFTGVTPGTYQVAQTQPLGYASFGDADGGDLDIVGDVTPIVVLPGQTNTQNNFIETDTCPDTWADWKAMHPGQTAVGNPDADAYDNLAEFAFAMPYDSGVPGQWLDGTAWIIRPAAGDTLEGVFVRPKGAPLNVTYTLQYAATPGNPTAWQSIVITPEMISTVDNGDCTETVTIHNLETVTGLITGKGVVRLQADLDEVPATGTDHTSYTETEGWKETALGLYCSTYNNPFLRETAFTGTVSAVNGQGLAFATSAGSVDLASVLSPGVAYYLEVTAGANEGQRFDVAAASGTTVTLANDTTLDSLTAPFNTRTGAPPNSLVGASVVLRRHWTLAEVFPPAGFVASDSQSTADEVQFFAGGAWTIYWLYNGNAPTRWVDAADAGMANQGTAVIPPGQGMFFNNRTAASTVLAYGEVRANDFIRPLGVAYNLVGGGYPVDQSATGTNGRALTLAAGLFGSRDFATADSFFVWSADSTVGATGYVTYYLLNGAPVSPSLIRWVKVGDAAATSRGNEALLLGNRAVFLRAAAGLPGYGYPSPWTP